MSVETKPEIKPHLTPEERKRLLDEAWAIKRKAIAEGKIDFMTIDEVNAEVRRRRSE